MLTPKRRAFFYPWPVLGQPGPDQRLLLLSRPRQGSLQTPAQLRQQAVDRVYVIAHTKFVLNELAHTAHGPALGWKARGQSPALELAQQGLLVAKRQARWS